MKILLLLLRVICISLPLFLLIALPSRSAKAADLNGKNGQQYVTIDFNDVDINVFVKYISELTGKNFIDERKIGNNHRTVPPKIAFPVIENASLKEDDFLQDLWANLLV
ncbi:MAG: hypothetical protein D3910_22270, partial [Candidatus Electrothrix sp. ATG2]|nr:hypothetical protein [Candidatus Electrothrix sp. ATG2]